MSFTRRHSQTLGVTLIETLAALTVVAIVLPTLTRAWSLSTASTGYSQASMLASVLAENKLNELRLANDVAAMSSEGEFGDENVAWSSFHWQSSLEEWSEDSSYQQLSVTVRWNRHNQLREITLTTLIPPSGL